MPPANKIALSAFLSVILFLTAATRPFGGLMASPVAGKVHRHLATNTVALREAAMSFYNEMELGAAGISTKAFEYAYRGYRYLASRHMLSGNILTICDMSQSSRRKRMYIIDMDARELLLSTYVAHGRGSGGEFARSFSNGNRSHKSSLGFYVTDNTYYGHNGLSLRLRGVEQGFNDRAMRRNIVVHGSQYVGDDFVQYNKINGRSFGCPAVPDDVSQQVIETIRGGNCLFVYCPVKKYLTRSKILNG